MRKLCVSLVAAVAAVGVWGSGALAASAGLTVSPPSYELSADPGGTLSNTIRVTNNSQAALVLQVSAQDFDVEDTEGSVTIKDDPNPNAFSKWFSFQSTRVQLGAGQTIFVPFTIKVPANAEPGGHFATVLFNPAVTAGTGQTGAQVIQRVGALMLMRVSGAVTESGSITKFHAKTFNGSYATLTGDDGKTKIYVANGEQLAKEHPKTFFSRGPIAFDLLFKNDGNIYFKPGGTVSIYNLFGHKVQQLALDPRNVFPHGSRRITVIWPKDRLWGGYYRAQATAVYGSQHKIMTAETVFFVFPATMLIIILVVLIVLVILRRRLMTAFRVLVKGN